MKPKWWALILAVILLLGSGYVVYQYPGFGHRGWGNSHMGGYGFNRGFDDNRDHMIGDWDTDEFEECFESDGGFGGHHGHRGGYMDSAYKLSEEDQALEPSVLAGNIAVKIYGEDATIKTLNVDESDVDAYQILLDDELVQIILIDSENNSVSFMHRTK